MALVLSSTLLGQFVAANSLQGSRLFGLGSEGVGVWDAASNKWHRLGPGLPDPAALTMYKDRLYAGGRFGFVVWDGATSLWQHVGGGLNDDADVTSVVEFEGELWIAGLGIRRAGNTSAHKIVRWDGTSFNPFNITAALSDAPSSVSMGTVA